MLLCLERQMLPQPRVIPAKAGIQLATSETVAKLDSRLRGKDGLREFASPSRMVQP
jgi:hypothetical protein